jgi:hypothetical protein
MADSSTVTAAPLAELETVSTPITSLIAEQPLPTYPAVSSAVANPNSRGVNDISDVRSGTNAVNLPTRAESRLVPTNVKAATIQTLYDKGYSGQGLGAGHKTPHVNNSDFYTNASTSAKRLLNDYIKIRLPHRGLNATTSQPDPTQAVEFRFLVNPTTLNVNRQTVDAQSITRGGWQFGIWGEDTFMVQLSGHTAGSMFTAGTTDEFSYYSVAYRNLMQMKQLFENNGYWFEGEEFNEGPLAPDYLRRRIRMHQDIELWVGNFIWNGMFDSMTISQEADNPFLMNFQLDFFVWKERFRSTSPYWGSIANNVQRGHSYSAVEGATNKTQTNTTLSQYAPSAVSIQQSQVTTSLQSNPNSASPSVMSAAADDIMSPSVATDVMGNLGTQASGCVMFPDNNSAFWLDNN